MRRHAPHGRVRGAGQGKGLPRLSVVRRAQHVPRLAGGGLAAAREHHAGIVGLHGEAARVGERPLRLDAHGLPRVAQVHAGEHLAVRARVDALGLGPGDGHGVDVRIVQARLQTRPRVAAVAAPEHAVDLDAGPHRAVIVGIHDQARHERRPDRALGGDLHGQALPRDAAVPRAVDRGGPRAREEDARFHGIDGQRPDRGQRARRSHPLPARAAVPAQEDAGVTGGVDRARLGGVRRQGLDAAVEREGRAMPHPRASRVRAVPYAPSRGSEADAVVRHRVAPLFFPRHAALGHVAHGDFLLPRPLAPPRSNTPSVSVGTGAMPTTRCYRRATTTDKPARRPPVGPPRHEPAAAGPTRRACRARALHWAAIGPTALRGDGTHERDHREARDGKHQRRRQAAGRGRGGTSHRRLGPSPDGGPRTTRPRLGVSRGQPLLVHRRPAAAGMAAGREPRVRQRAGRAEDAPGGHRAAGRSSP